MFKKKYSEEDFITLQDKIHQNLLEHFEPLLLTISQRQRPTEEEHRKMLRDGFAIAALQGCLAYSYCCPTTGNYHENSNPDAVAEVAYRYADAMLKARNQTDESVQKCNG